MCGRFALTLDPTDLQEAFPEYIFPKNVVPHFNIAPSQPILALPNDGTNLVDFFTWGLIPSWAKDPSIGYHMINARAETLAEKPAFRSAYKYHRCLIFTNGFFEWQARPGTKGKVPHFIHMKNGEPFAFAGLWERWQSPDGSEVLSTAIITTEPNTLVSPIHNRMPVILPRNSFPLWLDTCPVPPEELKSLLIPYSAEAMESYTISTLVNTPANDRPEIIVKV